MSSVITKTIPGKKSAQDLQIEKAASNRLFGLLLAGFVLLVASGAFLLR